MKQFIQQYLQRKAELVAALDLNSIERIKDALNKCHDDKGTIYILGNGGSAATASHMANDLAIGVKLKGKRQFNVVSLADNMSVCSAIANDTGFENIFSMQLQGVLTAKDLVIAITCSGNSPNLVKAADLAKETGATLIGITGFDGGYIKQVSDINFHVPSDKGEYGVVEDIHMMLDHILYSYYINE